MFRVTLIVFAILLFLLTLLSAYGGSLQFTVSPETFYQSSAPMDPSTFYESSIDNNQEEEQTNATEYFMTSSSPDAIAAGAAEEEIKASNMEPELGGFMVEPFEEMGHETPALF
jgi:hypothetical protein